MTALNTEEILATEGFRVAPTEKGKVVEAAKLFNEGMGGSNHAAFRLQEALSTSDFPIMLGKAFQVEAIQTQKDAVKEFESFTYETKVDDFKPKKMIDLFGSEIFEDVLEGEEYKGGKLDETEIEVSVGKTGKGFGLTWELRRNRQFSDLANFPKTLGHAAINTENKKVFEVFVAADGFKTDFFGTVDTKPLTPDNLQLALQSLALNEDHRGDLVDLTGMILLVGPTLQYEANRIINAAELELQVTDGTKVTKTRMLNPFRGLVTVVVSRRMTSIDRSATRASSWALLPNKASSNPSVVKANLTGEETVDIRVKRDQGDRVGGGAVSIEDGSFNDDTIWFRGRHIVGAAKGFDYAVYASKGA